MVEVVPPTCQPPPTFTNLHKPPQPSSVSQFHLRSDLEHLVRRDLEEGRGPQGVARHEGEQLRAPVAYAGSVGGDQRLATEEERRSRDEIGRASCRERV